MDNVIYEFYKTDCVPCKMISKKMDEIIKEYSNIVPIIKVDTGDGANKYLIDNFIIMSVPTAVVIKDGYEIDRFLGTSIPKQLVKVIEESFTNVSETDEI